MKVKESIYKPGKVEPEKKEKLRESRIDLKLK